MTAVQLACRGVPSMLIDGSGRMNRGVAYSTTEPVHLLNVPAAKMSAWLEQPAHFAEWLGDDGSSFAERRRFGQYLRQIAEAHAGSIQSVQASATSAERTDSGWRVGLDDGSAMAVQALVLANGNQPPASPRMADGLPGDLFVNNPWGADAHAPIARVSEAGGDVLILGTGLTMIDTVLSLDAAGHRGSIVALSRRGLAPRPHAPHDPLSIERAELPDLRLMPLWRWLRRKSGEDGFRAAVDSLRPHSHAIWQALSYEDRQRFLRHARPWWDVHRHRIAPEIGRKLAELIGEGRLEIVPGRVQELREDSGQAAARILRRRSGKLDEHRFAAVFNCTGPLGAIARTRDPLLRRLLDDGMLQEDELGIGVAVDGRSRAGEGLWAVGPMTKGVFWEIVAVPDIRGQAAAVADDIVRELAA